MELRPDQTQTCDALRENMTKASDMQTDAQASMTPALHPAWAKTDWQRLKLDSKCSHKGEIYRFCQPALADESQNREPGSAGSESIWAWLNYRDGYRVIPNPITATTTFGAGERGWWTDGKLYESKVANNAYTPAQHASNWTLVTATVPEGSTPEPEQPAEPTPEPVDEWPAWKVWSGNNADLYQVGDKVTHKGKKWISSQPNNHWEPGVFGWTEQK